MRKSLIGTTWALIPSTLAASLSVVACGTPPASGPSESDKLGSKAQAVLGGVDDTSPEANIVVALDGPNGEQGVCSGVLLTPTIVLTTRTCVGPTKAGSMPVVRVGSSLATAKTYPSVGSVVQSGSPGDPASTTESGDLAIVYLDPTRPVWDNVAIPRQPFIAPPGVSGSATGDGSQVYEHIGLSGWAPSGDAPGVRQQVTFDPSSTVICGSACLTI